MYGLSEGWSGAGLEISQMDEILSKIKQKDTGIDEYLDLDSWVQRDLDLRLEQVFQMIKSQVPHNEKYV